MILSLPFFANSGPICAYPLFVLESAPRVGDGTRHCTQALGG